MENFVVGLSSEEERVRSVLESLLDSEGYELVKIKIRQVQSGSFLALYIDTKEHQNGVTIDNLQDMSHLLSDVLDATFPDSNLFKGQYQLEVSSPGLDRPTTKLTHFKQAVGQRVKMRLKSNNEDRVKNISGLLTSVKDDGVTIALETKEVMDLAFADMADVHTVFDFSLINKNKKKLAKKG